MRRLLAVACVAVTAMGVLAGCASSAGGDPAAVEASFLAALSKGDGAAALALTTTGRSDVACQELITDYKSLGGGIAAATAGKATVSGDKATVGYSYSVVSGSTAVKASGTDALVRRDGTWLIQLPKADRISVAVPSDVVAELSIGGSPDRSGDCATKATGNAVELQALPGSYRVDLRDPTGVFESAFTSADVVVTGDKQRTTKLDFISAQDRELVSTAVRNALVPFVDQCAKAGFASTTCPTGLPSTAVTFADRPGARFTDYPTVTKIYSNNGTSWQFDAGGQSFTYMQGGESKTFPMTYTGTVTASAAKDGTVQVTLGK
jgi:hypothetical protein